MTQKEMCDRKWGKVERFIPETDFAKKCWSKIKDKNFKSLLDLGCGDGKDSVYFAKQGINVTALDFSDSALKHLEKRIFEGNLQNIKSIQGNIKDLQIYEKFDVIYANLSLHYFDDKTTTEIFGKILQLLNEGGYLFVRCKSVDDPFYGLGEKIAKDYFQRNGHLRHFFSKEYMNEKLSFFRDVQITKDKSLHHKVEEKPHEAAFVEAVARK